MQGKSARRAGAADKAAPDSQKADAKRLARMVQRAEEPQGAAQRSGVARAIQRQVGNAGVARMMTPGDDKAAKAGDEEAKAQRAYRSPEGQQVAPAGVEARIGAKRGTGQLLPEIVRRNLERRMGGDFARVQVHTDAEADRLARALKAKAFTVGADIFFRAGLYDPGSPAGQRLLAHELTNVMQHGGDDIRTKLEVSDPGDAKEHEAEAMAERVGRPASRSEKEADRADESNAAAKDL